MRRPFLEITNDLSTVTVSVYMNLIRITRRQCDEPSLLILFKFQEGDENLSADASGTFSTPRSKILPPKKVSHSVFTNVYYPVFRQEFPTPLLSAIRIFLPILRMPCLVLHLTCYLPTRFVHECLALVLRIILDKN